MSKYNPEVADAICEAISQGSSLVKACKEMGLYYGTVFKWLADNKDFENNYTRAREAQADYHADEIIGIADTEDDPNKARVRIDARKWVAGKMKPKKYGDSTQIKHADADGEKLSLKGLWDEVSGTGRSRGLPEPIEESEG